MLVSQRSFGMGRMASPRSERRRHKLSTSGAPGKRPAMPTTATSVSEFKSCEYMSGLIRMGDKNGGLRAVRFGAQRPAEGALDPGCEPWAAGMTQQCGENQKTGLAQMVRRSVNIVERIDVEV